MKKLFVFALMFIATTVMAISSDRIIECFVGDDIRLNISKYIPDTKDVVGIDVYFNGRKLGLDVNQHFVIDGDVDYYVILDIQKEQEGDYSFIKKYKDGSASEKVTFRVIVNERE